MSDWHSDTSFMRKQSSYTLTCEERSGYLYAHVQADTIDRENALEYLRQIAARRASTRARRLLIFREIPVMLSDSDLFFTTREFLEMIGSTRIAFVNPFSEIEDGMNFAMTIGVNRGANYRLFSSAERAEEWLQRDLKAA
jgi:hypothetical protein